VSGNARFVDVSSSFSNVDIVASDTLVAYTGGLFGIISYVALSNSFSIGTVNGSNYLGGAIGSNSFSSVQRCYSASVVSETRYYFGGFLGYNAGGANQYSYWDTEVSTQPLSAGGTGRTTEQMKQISNYSGWSIVAVATENDRNTDYIWNIVEGETYPFLSWTEPEVTVIVSTPIWLKFYDGSNWKRRLIKNYTESTLLFNRNKLKLYVPEE
jgi:hypothetical protein